jgi:ABC-type Fe3+ transport system permease subunit
LLAAILLLIAVVSIRWQLGNLRRMRAQPHMPSDDRSYLRKQTYRRLVMGALLIALAGMLAGWYLSGLDQQADQFGQKQGDAAKGDRQEGRALARFYLIYWISILVLLFLVVSLAIVDLWATRRYAWEQLRRIQNENRAMLERDLAMYRQQKLNDRMRRLE